MLWAFAALAPAWASSAVAAGPAAPPVISSQQINRFEAIRQLQQAVKQNSKSLADWVILGELAHEVAIDLPPDQAETYYKLSRNAYENALALAPDNVGLKAAVQFAKDQEQGLDRFEKSRSAATQMYLAARRRDLSATRFSPSLRVYGPTMAPPTGMAGTGTANLGTSGSTTGNAGRANSAATVSSATNDPSIRRSPTGEETAIAPSVTATNSSSGLSSANMGVRQFYTYPYPTYQAYAQAEGAPLTYQQYSSSYYPPNDDAGQAVQPVTLQRYYSQQGLGLPIPGDPTGRPSGSGVTNPTGRPSIPGGTTTTPPAPPR